MCYIFWAVECFTYSTAICLSDANRLDQYRYSGFMDKQNVHDMKLSYLAKQEEPFMFFFHINFQVDTDYQLGLISL